MSPNQKPGPSGILRACARLGLSIGTALLAGTAAATMNAAVWAQDYPSRAIKLVVPYPAGGSTDVAGRLIALEMAKVLGQPVVVENRAGGAGAIGIGTVAKANSDGYTLGVSGVSPTVIMDLVGAPANWRCARRRNTSTGAGQMVAGDRNDIFANAVIDFLARVVPVGGAPVHPPHPVRPLDGDTDAGTVDVP